MVQFLVRKPLVLAILLLSVTIFIFNGIRKLSITEDIFAALPKGKLFQQFNSLIETKNISNQVLFSIAANGENDPDLHQQLIDEAAALLDSTCKNYLQTSLPHDPIFNRMFTIITTPISRLLLTPHITPILTPVLLLIG